MGYVLKEQDIFEYASFIGAETKQKGNELFFKTCPVCNGGLSDDEWTFSINLDNGCYHCFRSTCDANGHFVELCRDSGFNLEYEQPKAYRQIPQPKKFFQPTEAVLEYLANRGICENVARKYEISNHKKQTNVMVFPFYDDQGRIQTFKYRDMNFKKGMKGNKEWFEKDTMPILFGMKQANEFDKPLVITEGQIDALSVAEIGVPNAVSVPNGAKGFTWIVPCWEWLKKFETVIIFGDWEKGKMTLLDVLKMRLTENHIKAVRKQDYLGEKDANAILCKYGRNALMKCIDNAEEPKIEYVKDLSMVESVDLDSLEKISTQIPTLDQYINGLSVGQVILLSGKRGEGKSTFMSQLIANALDQGENVFVYSGELANFHFKRWLDMQLAGISHLERKTNSYGVDSYSMTDETVDKISKWYKGRAFIYDSDFIPDGDDEFESLASIIEKVIKQNGIRLICIDNLMTAMDVVTHHDDLYLSQSNFVGKLKKIAMKYQVVIILVAHPRKSFAEDFTNDDVSGSSDITNKVDVVLNFARNKDVENENFLTITKNRLMGALLTTKTSAIKLWYENGSRRITEINNDGTHGVHKPYGWERIQEKSTTMDDYESWQNADDIYVPF